MAFTRSRPRSRGSHPAGKARALEAWRNVTTRPTVHQIKDDTCIVVDTFTMAALGMEPEPEKIYQA